MVFSPDGSKLPRSADSGKQLQLIETNGFGRRNFGNDIRRD